MKSLSELDLSKVIGGGADAGYGGGHGGGYGGGYGGKGGDGKSDKH